MQHYFPERGFDHGQIDGQIVPPKERADAYTLDRSDARNPPTFNPERQTSGFWPEPLSRELGTNKTVEDSFWPWISGASP